jgi:ribosomal protein RSM22 (predicted rRNA methylase)
MEMPPQLRQAVERALNGVALADLAATAAELSQRYREERRDGRLHVASESAALAYLAVRLPATYAAIRASFAAIAQAQPGFAPKTILDIGAGPGTALWAAADCWPGLGDGVGDALLIEANAIFQACGERLAAEAALPRITWRIADIASLSPDSAPRDLVTLAYVLNEIEPQARPRVLQQSWQATADTMVVIEPGTPAGWQRILAARQQLIDAGAHVIAPCPHALACPLRTPDWCHFAQRVARSRLHRQAKSADVPWEDEKFIYVAVSRTPAATAGTRVIAPPRRGSGRVTLKLCRADGSAGEQLFSRRDGAAFKRADRGDWGSAL